MEPLSTPPEKRKKPRRNEVLDAARELFFGNGYHGTSIQQVARRAGYSKRTVYLDYLNKDELFISLCAEGGELLLEKLKQIPHEELPIETAMDRVMKEFVDFSSRHPAYFRMIFSEATPEIIANCSEPLRGRVADLERACLSVVVHCAEQAMQEGIIPEMDPWEVAGIFVGSATGIILLSMGGSQTVFSRKTLESLVQKAIWTLWRGLQTPGPSRPEETTGENHGRRNLA